MMKKYGVALDDETAEYIEQTRSGPNDRSQRIREMCLTARAAEEIMTEYQWFPQDVEDRVEMVREAMDDYIQQNRG